MQKNKKHPNIIGTYFGVLWRDTLFPNLDEHYQRQRAELLTKELSAVKQEYNLLSHITKESEHTYSGATIEIKPVVEGYVRDKAGVAQFHGDFPSNRGFCLKYSVSFDVNNTDMARTMFSIVLSPEDAVDLEAVLLMDIKKQASRSTYYSHDVLLTHIQGATPMISLLSKDLTFMLARNSDYHLLLTYVEAYLNKYKDVALSARRYRTLKEVSEDTPKLDCLLF